MKVSNRTRLAIIFKLFLLIIFLILCFVIKQNVEYMLPEVVEYAVLDSSNVISFSEADEAAYVNSNLTVNVLSRKTGDISTKNNTGLSEKVNIIFTDDKFPMVHNINLLKGSFFSNDNPLNVSEKIIISDNLANSLFKSYDVIGNEIVIFGKKKIISGIYITENNIFSELASNGQETVFVSIEGQTDSPDSMEIERIYFKGLNGEINNMDIREFDVLTGEKLKYYQKTDLFSSKNLLKQMINIMFLIAGVIVILKLIFIFIKSFENIIYGLEKKNYNVKAINIRINIIICLICLMLIILIFALCTFKLYIPDGLLPEHDRILDIKYYYHYIINSIQSVKLLERWSYYQTLIIVFNLFPVQKNLVYYYIKTLKKQI